MAPMESVARELGLLIRGVKSLHQAAVAAAGVRVEQPALAVLTVLDADAPLRPSALAEVLHLDLSSISRQVAAVEREGWVSRSRDPLDSRAALLELTPAGRDVLARVRAGRVSELSSRLPGWTSDDLAAFAEQLRRFRHDLSTGPHTAPTDDLGDDRRTATSPLDTIPALAGQES